MSYIEQAWEMAIKEPQIAHPCYLCLISTYRAYGGPEEGGWWYDVSTLEEWKEFPSREAAEETKEQLEKIADELNFLARQEHGSYCQRSMEWLEARGLEADFLPEPDGEEKYIIEIHDTLPVFDNNRPHWS